MSSAFEYGGPGCDRCGAGVWVVPGAHRQSAWPVPIGDQGRDQAQRGRRRVLQGRGGGAHGRTPTRPSQGARPRCRPCSAVPCRVRPRPGPNAPPDQRAPQGRSVQRGGAPCAGSPAADGRTISHEAIYTWIHTPSRGRNLVGARDRAALTALGAQEGPRRRAQAPDRGHAVDRAGALTIDDRVVPGNWEDAA